MGIADGYAQASGSLAAVNVHVQPGLANAMSGILNAARARVPVLVTVGQQVQDLLPGEPFLGGELVELAPPARQGGVGGHPRRGPAAPPGAGGAHGPRGAERPRGAEPAAGRPGRAGAPAPRAAAAGAPGAAGRRRRSTGPPSCSAPRAPRRCWPATRWPGPGRRRSWRPWPSAWGRRSWASPWPPRCRCPPTIRSGAGRCRPSRPRSRRSSRPTTWCSPWGCRCSGCSATSPGSALPAADGARAPGGGPPRGGQGPRARRRPRGRRRGSGSPGCASAWARPPAQARERRDRAAAEAAAARAAARARVEAAARGERVDPAAFARAVAGAVERDDLVVDEALTTGRGLRAVIGPRTPATWLAHRGSALGWGLPAAVGAALAEPGAPGDGPPGRRQLRVRRPGALDRRPRGAAAGARGGRQRRLRDPARRPGGDDRPARGRLARPRPAGAGPRRGGDLPRVRRARPRAPTGRPTSPRRCATCGRRAREGPAALVVGVTGRTPPVGYPIPGASG